MTADTLNDAIRIYGKSAQVDMAIEEMSELHVALLHERRGRENNIAEEIADTEIMLQQLEMIFDVSKEVETIKAEKLERLKERLKGKTQC